MTSDQAKKKSTKRTLWHRLLGDLFNFLLSPVGIAVHVELPLMSESPRVDILLLKREEATWTDEQLHRLPDGLRSSQAKDLLLEFKCQREQTAHHYLGLTYRVMHIMAIIVA